MSGHIATKWHDGSCLMPADPAGYILDKLLRWGSGYTGEQGAANEVELLAAMRRLGESWAGSCGPASPVISWRGTASPRVTVSCDFTSLPGSCQKSVTLSAADILRRFRQRRSGEQLELFAGVAS